MQVSHTTQTHNTDTHAKTPIKDNNASTNLQQHAYTQTEKIEHPNHQPQQQPIQTHTQHTTLRVSQAQHAGFHIVTSLCLTFAIKGNTLSASNTPMELRSSLSRHAKSCMLCTPSLSNRATYRVRPHWTSDWRNCNSIAHTHWTLVFVACKSGVPMRLFKPCLVSPLSPTKPNNP
jgi:hypothetical protein